MRKSIDWLTFAIYMLVQSVLVFLNLPLKCRPDIMVLAKSPLLVPQPSVNVVNQLFIRSLEAL